MTANRKYFVDVFSDIVDDVVTLCTANGIDEPNYLYGHFRDIVDILTERDQSGTYKFTKYPLICLIQDFTEEMGNSRNQYTVSPTVLIVTDTEMTYHSSDRYTNIFKPILYPIYEYLLEAMNRSSHLWHYPQDEIPHKKTDRVYWGKLGLYGSGGTVFNDRIDAIELKFENLEIKKQLNC